jgi:hypothetical protein
MHVVRLLRQTSEKRRLTGDTNYQNQDNGDVAEVKKQY